MEEIIGLTLIRHGRSRADDEGVHEGRYDSPLTDTGRAQAEKRGQYLLAQGTKYQLDHCQPVETDTRNRGDIGETPERAGNNG